MGLRGLNATKTPFGIKRCPRVSGPKIMSRLKRSISRSRKNTAAPLHGFFRMSEPSHMKSQAEKPEELK